MAAASLPSSITFGKCLLILAWIILKASVLVLLVRGNNVTFIYNGF
jgi:hypothetical protein